MATKKYTIKGKAMWAKVFEHNGEVKDYQGNPHPFGKLFKLDIILDKENKAIYKSSGTAGKGKFDDDGNFIATLKRKEKEKFEWAGGVPKVTMADGSPFTEPFIPNGSEVECEFSVYTTSMQPGTRLESVKVISLVETPERKDSEIITKETTISKVNIDIPF